MDKEPRAFWLGSIDLIIDIDAKSEDKGKLFLGCEMGAKLQYKENKINAVLSIVRLPHKLDVKS